MVAVCLVIYSHLVGIWLHQHHDSSTIAAVLQGFAAHPLNLSLDLGDFGVVLFFLVSGFIVTHTGFQERPRQYAIKRFLRIYPMLLAAVLVSAVLFTVGLHPLTTGHPATVTPLTLLTSTSLANYLLTPQIVLVDVTWTLVIEVLFYALLLAALPLLRRRVLPVLLGEFALVAVVLLTAHVGGTTYALFAMNVSYLPALLLGQVVWAAWSRRVPLWAGAVLGVLAWSEYVWASGPGQRTDPAYHYDVNLAIGLAVFLVGLLAEPRLRRVRLVGYLADRSYSLYLLHGVLGYAAMNLLAPRIGFPAALVAGLAVTLLGVEAAYRWVEQPSMRLARRIARRWRHA
jgi:peptidoglycan/LPS O-acetylase OafA/YrhL